MQRHWRMAVIAIITTVVVAPRSAWAEPFTVNVPSQGWRIEMDVPPLAQFMGESKGPAFIFRSATADGLNLSIFVEPPSGKILTHEACYQRYWPLAKQNPIIDLDSVKVAQNDRYVKVSYECKVPQGTKTIQNRHVNYYFFYKGRFCDVHVSRYWPDANDDTVFAAFDRGFKYTDDAPAAQPATKNEAK
ncbi:MAG: hypothetical protein JSS27_13950 [Planctomycetes bacterium]|nr:hypothetical protein [Planctomycetota bacterium]